MTSRATQTEPGQEREGHTEGHVLSHLGQSRSLDEVIELPQRRVPRQTLDVPEQVLRLGLKEPPDWRRQHTVNKDNNNNMIITTMVTLYKWMDG